jgi:hypothetical protein
VVALKLEEMKKKRKKRAMADGGRVVAGARVDTERSLWK